MPHRKVAYLGPPASFTHEAALAAFSRHQQVEFLPFVEVEQIVDAVYRDEADFGVVPSENSTEGVVSSTYRSLILLGEEPEVSIQREHYSRINHFLLGIHGANLGSLQGLLSIPIARGQCKTWLHDYLPDIQFTPTSSTSDAAQTVARAKDMSLAAIASERAAIEYDLQILRPRIQTNKNNTTRFLVIGNGKANKSNRKANKATIGVVLADEPGSLSDVCVVLKSFSLNITSIKSIPAQTPLYPKWHDIFFFDFIAPAESSNPQSVFEDVIESIENLSNVSVVRLLGIYQSKAAKRPNHSMSSRNDRVRSLDQTRGADALLNEGQFTEFKSTFAWNLETKQKDKYIEFACLKTIVAFMNADGGRLLIGVSDSGEALGLDNDYRLIPRRNSDGFETHARDYFRSQLGTHVKRVSFSFNQVESKEICEILVEQAPKPVWLQHKGVDTLFVRMGNQSVPLQGEQAVAYIEEHWNQIS